MRQTLTLASAAMLVLASLATAGSAAAFGPPDHAVGPEPGACPSEAWWPVQPQHGLIALDFNGDTWLCRKDTASGPLFIDNNAR